MAGKIQLKAISQQISFHDRRSAQQVSLHWITLWYWIYFWICCGPVKNEFQNSRTFAVAVNCDLKAIWCARDGFTLQFIISRSKNAERAERSYQWLHVRKKYPFTHNATLAGPTECGLLYCLVNCKLYRQLSEIMCCMCL